MERSNAKVQSKAQAKADKKQQKADKKQQKADKKQQKAQAKSEKKNKVEELPTRQQKAQRFGTTKKKPASPRSVRKPVQPNTKTGNLRNPNPRVNIRNASHREESAAAGRTTDLPTEIREVIARHHRQIYFPTLMNQLRVRNDVTAAGRHARFDLNAPTGDGDVADAVFMGDFGRIPGHRANQLRQRRAEHNPGGGY